MPALQIRSCPERVNTIIKERASANHRSISQETLCILEDYFNAQGYCGESFANKQRRAGLIEDLAKMPPLPIPEGLSARTLIDEGRE